MLQSLFARTATYHLSLCSITNNLDGNVFIQADIKAKSVITYQAD
jgi:hypothetical protein